jgi:hypothetical protein
MAPAWPSHAKKHPANRKQVLTTTEITRPANPITRKAQQQPHPALKPAAKLALVRNAG